MVDSTESSDDPLRWLVLTHHLPAEPAYLRVKVRRRLDGIGAVPLKASVYVLPSDDDAREDFAWLRQEIVREGGEATLSEAVFVDGETDGVLVARFQEAASAGYREIESAARALRDAATAGDEPDGAELRRLSARMEDNVRRDFFGADGREEARRALAGAARAAGAPSGVRTDDDARAEVGRGRTWVTRRGVKVDRIASAWLIRRFIDREARFRFVAPDGYRPAEGELRFDMFEGEFTHEGDACTFETLLVRFGLEDPALGPIAEIVHDIDCKDDRFGRSEASGVASLIDGIARRYPEDAERMERGGTLFDELLEHFRAP